VKEADGASAAIRRAAFSRVQGKNADEVVKDRAGISSDDSTTGSGRSSGAREKERNAVQRERETGKGTPANVMSALGVPRLSVEGS